MIPARLPSRPAGSSPRQPQSPGSERAATAIALEALAERGFPGARPVSRAPERPDVLLTLAFGPGGC